ncbi:beta-lactamase family protein [Aquimarina sp. U1-2]|uniref:serine hydrolase domain-containing protein n=1 Tax=Aquimarina sp. U1-2 TaxID=2823141 RepID=UPI001AEC8393|nr:serine hydrolase domain-containing protein [Aquimarina sp. U1-2]MBP2833029.1 beta-lactamase family protein [Aquimarina sp. U1-2]
MKYIFRISLGLICISTIGCKNNKPDKKIQNIELTDNHSERIDSLIQIKEPHFFNGVILITKDAEIVYKKEYGYPDFDNKVPISLNDKFRIGSNSKQITAVLILKEVEKGTIDLHKPIKEYLPNFNQSWTDSGNCSSLIEYVY